MMDTGQAGTTGAVQHHLVLMDTGRELPHIRGFGGYLELKWGVGWLWLLLVGCLGGSVELGWLLGQT